MTNRPLPHPDSRFPSYSEEEADEIGLYDVFLFLKAGWIWIVATAAAGLLIGGGYALFAPQKFQAAANLQMAMVANEAVESPAVLAEKLKLPLYYSPAIYSACGVTDSVTPGESLVKGLKPSVNRNAPMVNISFEGGTETATKQCLNAVLDYVSSNQSTLAEPVIAAKKNQLAALQQRLKEAEKLKLELDSKISSTSSSESKSSSSGILLSTLSATNQEMKELITEISKLQVALSAAQTRPTSFATPIYVREIMTTSKRLLIAVAATMAGLFLGITLLLMRNAWQKTKRKLQAASADSLAFLTKNREITSTRKPYSQHEEGEETTSPSI